MSKKLFIGNIEWGVTEDELKELFGKYGEVEEGIIIRDRMSGRSKGYGFITFANEEDADKAMEALNGYELNGRKLAVNEARERE
jgi:RNA recognition motif-containing protein